MPWFQVIAVRNEGYDATLRLLSHDGSTFDLNMGAIMIGNHRWRLVQPVR